MKESKQVKKEAKYFQLYNDIKKEKKKENFNKREKE